MIRNNKKIVVGMSGGVDSAVAAFLLKEKGYNVIGLFMNNWDDTDEYCTATEDFEDVKRVCNQIGIPYYSVDFSKEYKEKVFENFLNEYKKGRTPNPDVLCNREIKFGPFLDYAKKIGADFIATGHYARIEEKNGLFYLKKGKDKNKYQSYFLNQLNQNQLKNVIFPLGDLKKEQIREIASKNNFINARKKDSTGICFIGERDFKNFLKEYIPANPGIIIDTNNNKVGSHDGLMFYTLGQRRGLNIGGKANGTGERWFVVDKDVKNNKLIVAQGDDSQLYSESLILENIHWIADSYDEKKFKCKAKFRYRQEDQDVEIDSSKKNEVFVKFKNKQRAVTPGQWAVFYKDDICLGGGIIKKTM